MTSSSQDPIVQPLPWERARRSSSVANTSLRRNSLLSASLFEYFASSKNFEIEAEDQLDPFAPLSIYEGISMTKQLSHSQRNTGEEINADYELTDRSESSVPSVSASSFSSQGSPRRPLMFYRHLQQEQAPSRRANSCYFSATNSDLASAIPLGSIDDLPFVDSEEEDQISQSHRFKPFHEEKWELRYKELLRFHSEFGHSAVPHTYHRNPQLARWVKRQRRQYKLRRDDRTSTMTSERLELLDTIGFVWDSHEINWTEKLRSLGLYREKYGHCNVPSNSSDKKLATWVKCQRRQYKLYWDGKPSAMSPERILQLEKVGFEWEIRTAASRPMQTISASKKLSLLSFHGLET